MSLGAPSATWQARFSTSPAAALGGPSGASGNMPAAPMIPLPTHLSSPADPFPQYRPEEHQDEPAWHNISVSSEAHAYSAPQTPQPAYHPAMTPAAAPKPIVWQPSAQGGYYDSSGQVQGVHQASELNRFGPSQIDPMNGTGLINVPSGNVLTDAAGHIYSPQQIAALQAYQAQSARPQQGATVGAAAGSPYVSGTMLNGNGGAPMTDAEFRRELAAFMPSWNTANSRARMAELERNNQKGGWEYEMLADSLRPGWNVPQGQVAMSAGNQHVNQLMQYAAQGVVPPPKLLEYARYMDQQWDLGGPATKLPMISAIGDLSGGEAAAPQHSEVYGPLNVTGAGGNWGTAGGANPSQWNHNYQGDTSTGPYSYQPSPTPPNWSDSGYVPQYPGGGWVDDDGIQGFTPQGQPIYAQPYQGSGQPFVDPNAGQPTVTGKILGGPNALNYGHTDQPGEPRYELLQPNPNSPAGILDPWVMTLPPASYQATPVPVYDYGVERNSNGPVLGVEGYLARMGAPGPQGYQVAQPHAPAPVPVVPAPAPQNDWFSNLFNFFGTR